MLRYAPVVAIGRLVRWVARKRKPGGGAAIPGVVVNKLAPGFLGNTLNSFPQGLVVVTGTAGKSTTTRMLAAVVSAHGRRVFTNPSTANIAQGLTSAILAQSSFTGHIDSDIAILEMDEGHAAKLSAEAAPRVSILLNVCVDQVDRFFDPQLVTAMLSRVAQNTSETIVYNGDDASVVDAVAGVAAQKNSFVMGSHLRAQDIDKMGYARVSTAATSMPTVTLQSAEKKLASLEVDGHEVSVSLPSAGIHYGVDAAAALAASRSILGSDFDVALAVSVISALDPVFGRGETITVRGQEIDFVLIQNPTSYRLNLNSMAPNAECVMIAVGSDVRDYSYLWPVHMDHLEKVAIAAGPKAKEVAIHALYGGCVVGLVEPDLNLALEKFLALPTPLDGRKTLVFSADSMRRTRRYFGLAEQEAWS